MLIWATFLGYVVFGDFPDALTVTGAIVIVVSGLLAWNWERKGI